MRKNGLKVLLLVVAVAAVLCGCSEIPEVTTISDSQQAKDALNTASSVYFEGDFEEVNQSTDILADDAIAGHMDESGIIKTEWTVTTGGETWFYMKMVTDEPVNEDTDDYVTALTYGYYDENDNCLGYAQKRALKGGDVRGYFFYFMDAQQNLRDYRAYEDGSYLADMEGNVLAEAYGNADAVGSGCYIQIDMAKGCDTQIDFMDKMVLYIEQFDELKDRYSN